MESWNDALLVDLRLAGLVEAWAAGATWSEVGGKQWQLGQGMPLCKSPHLPTVLSWNSSRRSTRVGWVEGLLGPKARAWAPVCCQL